MRAIPTSDMPGHTKLHQKVCNALDRCQESTNLDFKASASWDDLRLALIRTAMAMANLRDGGIIVVGASESGDATWRKPPRSSSDCGRGGTLRGSHRCCR